MKKIISTAAMIGVLFLMAFQNPADAQSSNAVSQLRSFIKEVKTAQGTFEQISEGGKKKHSERGDFLFSRPGKFVWHITQPYSQSIISNGRIVYQYDEDLMQVTERPVKQSMGSSPASILFGQGDLDKSFRVKELPDSNGEQWLRATPKVPDAGLSHIDIGFADGLPKQLKILDSFGQVTVIRFKSFLKNVLIPANKFNFKPPTEVTVVKMKD